MQSKFGPDTEVSNDQDDKGTLEIGHSPTLSEKSIFRYAPLIFLVASMLPVFQGCAKIQIPESEQEYSVATPTAFQSKLDIQNLIPLNWAVVVVDMQQVFWNNADIHSQNELSNHLAVLKHCAEHNIPTVLLSLTQENNVTSPFMPEIQEALSHIPQNTIINRKIESSGFTNPALENLLRQWNVNAVFFIGAYGPECIRATAQDAKERGFVIATSRQVMATRDYSKLFRSNNDENTIVLQPIVQATNVDIFLRENGLYSDNYQDFLQPGENEDPILRYSSEF